LNPGIGINWYRPPHVAAKLVANQDGLGSGRTGNDLKRVGPRIESIQVGVLEESIALAVEFVPTTLGLYIYRGNVVTDSGRKICYLDCSRTNRFRGWSKTDAADTVVVGVDSVDVEAVVARTHKRAADSINSSPHRELRANGERSLRVDVRLRICGHSRRKRRDGGEIAPVEGQILELPRRDVRFYTGVLRLKNLGRLGRYGNRLVRRAWA
jgi:hypothetical protein